MVSSLKSVMFLIESCMVDVVCGDVDVCYDLGIVYLSGLGGVDVDLVQVYKWFNFVVFNGNECGYEC